MFLALFEPALPYVVPKGPVDDAGEQFVRTLQALPAAYVDPATKLEVLTNGEVSYANELDAIRKARRTINNNQYHCWGSTCGLSASNWNLLDNPDVYVQLCFDTALIQRGFKKWLKTLMS